MFVLSFLYPRPKARAFDYEYHRNVHMPLGIGLTTRHLGVQPRKAWIERIDEDNPSSDEIYAAIAHVAFETRADRDLFATLFDNAEAARRLTADWSKYTDAPPEVRLSRWTVDEDMTALIERFESDLSDLHA